MNHCLLRINCRNLEQAVVTLACISNSLFKKLQGRIVFHLIKKKNGEPMHCKGTENRAFYVEDYSFNKRAFRFFLITKALIDAVQIVIRS